MRILLLTAMIIFASSAFAGLYKWVDDEGNIHYSQKRPADQQYERLKAPAPAPENSGSLYESTKTKSPSNNAIADEAAKSEKLRASNCENAKTNLRNYTVYRRFRDKDGNATNIDDKVRAKRIEEAKQAINDFCN